jgi:hypothetical protein
VGVGVDAVGAALATGVVAFAAAGFSDDAVVAGAFAAVGSDGLGDGDVFVEVLDFGKERSDGVVLVAVVICCCCTGGVT